MMLHKDHRIALFHLQASVFEKDLRLNDLTDDEIESLVEPYLLEIKALSEDRDLFKKRSEEHFKSVDIMYQRAIKAEAELIKIRKENDQSS